MYCRFHGSTISRIELMWWLLVPEPSRRSPQLGLPKARFDGFPRTRRGYEVNVTVTPLGLTDPGFFGALPHLTRYVSM